MFSAGNIGQAMNRCACLPKKSVLPYCSPLSLCRLLSFSVRWGGINAITCRPDSTFRHTSENADCQNHPCNRSDIRNLCRVSRRTGKVQRLHGKCDQFHAFRHIEPSFNFGIRSGVGLPVRRILVLHWYARIQKTDVCLSGMR